MRHSPNCDVFLLCNCKNLNMIYKKTFIGYEHVKLNLENMLVESHISKIMLFEK